MARKPNAIPPKSNAADGLIEEDEEGKSELVVVADDDGETIPEVANGAAEESIESLRAQLEEANNRIANEAAAREKAELEARKKNDQVIDSNLQVIETAIGRAATDKKALLSEIATAKEAGDYAAEAEAIDKLQTINIQIARLNEGKNELERRNKEAEEFNSLSPIEQYVRDMPDASANWVREHSEYVLDPVKRPELEAAHYRALGARIPPGTPQYFEYIERELGLAEDGGDEPRTPAPRQTPRPPAAPVGRSRTGGAGASALPDGVEDMGGGRYRLNAARREAARISGLSDKQYLENLLALQREGAITH